MRNRSLRTLPRPYWIYVGRWFEVSRLSMKIIHYPLCVIVIFPCLAVAKAAPPKTIDVSNFPAKMVEDVVVPVPSEVFNVMSKLGGANWHGVMRTDELSPSGDRAQIALLFGTVIADGFVAVEAGDAEAVKKIGRSVLRLAQALGVKRHVLARTESILEGADKKDWQLVKRELDGAQFDVKSAMVDLGDADYAQLVSLGGWIRGTEAMTTILEKDYSEDGAELLHQPTLLDYFIQRISRMSDRIKGDSVVKIVSERLPEIEPLIESQDGIISTGSVKKIQEITASMVSAITSKSS